MALRLQDLPAPAAHLVLKVERFLRQELKVSTQNKSLLLSLSGGPDSTALALILTLLKKRLKLKEIAGFYLDHGLRKESKEEKRFLEDLSQRQGFSLYFFSTRVDLIAQKTGKGLEEIGRNLRYKLLT
ncbi:MAG TPA: tRNA lysidine(34) synthetase TilS, partial [Desulfonauticus sp.]|nr:tRNA lysidine(34) synthetase TilS [Desulfonauticus sp.]